MSKLGIWSGRYLELMKMSDSIHSLVIKSASAPDIREVALEEGMSTLQGSGWAQIEHGLTTWMKYRCTDGMVEEDSPDISADRGE